MDREIKDISTELLLRVQKNFQSRSLTPVRQSQATGFGMTS